DLAIRAHDANPGDVLTIRWTASVGSFSDWTSSTPQWIAPTTEGPATLTVQVTDSKAATQSLSFVVQVNAHAVGRADVYARVNTWPVVPGPTASSNQVQASQTTTLNLQVSDADGDPLTIAWTDGGCGGTFSNTTTQAPTWTAPASLTGITSCTLRADITDGRG